MSAEQSEVGACILLLDFPPGYEIGIDFKCWKVGSRFRGIKKIPCGLHLIYFSPVDKLGQVGIRTGFFQHFSEDSLVVKKWNPKEEVFIDGLSSEEDTQRYRDHLIEISFCLGPYPQDLFPKWVAHSCHVSPALLARVAPDNRLDCVPAYVSPASNTAERRQRAMETVSVPETAASTTDTDVDAVLASRRAPSASDAQKETNLRFSTIQLRTYPAGSTAAQISQHMLDRSYSLRLLLESYAQDDPTSMLLGEMQLAFLAFLLCNDFCGFEQWKAMISLLCRCPSEMTSRASLFEELISVLYHQVKEIPEDFFTDIVSSENFLIEALRALFAGLEGAESSATIRRKADGFQQFLVQRFGWDLEEEGEEDKPVMVEAVL